jgi:hypothetical protein
MTRHIREAQAIATESATKFAAELIGLAAFHSALPRHLLQGLSLINAISGHFGKGFQA